MNSSFLYLFLLISLLSTSSYAQETQSLSGFTEINVLDPGLFPRDAVGHNAEQMRILIRELQEKVSALESQALSGLPGDAILLVTTPDCPAGWRIYEPGQGKYVLGSDGTAGQNPGETGGFNSITFEWNGQHVTGDRGANDSVSPAIGHPAVDSDGRTRFVKLKPEFVALRLCEKR